MANKYKFEKDDEVYRSILEAAKALNDEQESNTNNTTKNDNDEYYKSDDELLKSFYSNYEKQAKLHNEMVEKKKKEQEEYEKAQQIQQEKVDYYNQNKDKMVTDRTNKLIYSWDLNEAGGLKYNYNGAIDTTQADSYSNLGINDLSLDNFLIRDELAEYNKKASQWNDRQNINDRFNEISNSRNNNKYTNTNIPSSNRNNNINPYENRDSYYKKYIEEFNSAIKNNEIVKANNAIEKINSKYFGADYDDGILESVTNSIFGYKDASTLEKRFNENLEKLGAINNSIANGTDSNTLAKLEAEKSKLEFENQLIQYNRLLSIYSNNKKLEKIDSLAYDYDKSLGENLTGIEGGFDFDFKWKEDRNVVENITHNMAELVNGATQIVSATSGKIAEEVFDGISFMLTNDMNEGLKKDFALGMIDFASYLVPYVGQAKLILDTASEAGVLIPGMYNFALDSLEFFGVDADIDRQESIKLGGDNPNMRQTFGSLVYIGMNIWLDKILKSTPLSKFQFDDATRAEIAKMSYDNILKSLGVTGLSEGTEEFIQAYAEEAVYGDQDKTIFTKETAGKALKNFLYAFIVSVGVSGTQVGSSKLKYKNSVTTDTVYTDTVKPKTAGKTSGSGKVESSPVGSLPSKIEETLNKGDAIQIINPNVSTNNTGIEIENTTVTETIKPNRVTNAQSITFDDGDLIVLDSISMNTKFFEDNNLSNNPTLREVYDILVSQRPNSTTDKLFHYVEIYGNTKFSKFMDGIENKTITPEKVAAEVLPENNVEYINNKDLTDSTTTTIVPSAEMKTYVENNNPNANVIVIDPKSPTYNQDIKNYVEGKAQYNLGFKEDLEVDTVEPTISADDIKNIESMATSFKRSMIKYATDENINGEALKIDTSVLATGDITTIVNHVKDAFLNDYDMTSLYTKSQIREEYKKLAKELRSYLKNVKRTTIKDSNGNVVVFNKTGLNTYTTANELSGKNIIPTTVKTTGKVIYGNSEAKLKLTERAVNRVNKMIDTLGLKGDYITTRSTGKDIQTLIDKNKDMSKEILDALGYDGIISGKNTVKYISAVDNADSANLKTISKNAKKEVDKIIASEKEIDAKTEFMARMQIARDMMGGSTIRTPEKVTTKQQSTKNVEVKTDLDIKPEVNRVNKTITDQKVDANQEQLDFDKDFTINEQYAIEEWRGAESYKIQDRLRRGEKATSLGIVNGKNQSLIVKHLDKVLNKVKSLDGRFNRSLVFDTKAEMDEFVAKYKKGSTVTEKGYMSAAKEGIYEMEGFDGKHPDVIVQIISPNAKDVSYLMRPEEQEVMFNRNTKLEILEVVHDNKGHVYIQAKDITNTKTESKKVDTSKINKPIKTEAKVKVGEIEVEGNTELYSVDVLNEINSIDVQDKRANRTMKDAFTKIYSWIVDRYHPIQKIANESADLEVKNSISDVYAISNIVHNNINVAQLDINNNQIGKSIKQIKKQIRKGDEKHFDSYMRLLLNAERIDNKMEPLLNVSAKKSRETAAKIEAKYPYFKSIANNIKTYNVNSNAKLREAGIITKAQEEAANRKYQYYFPVYTADTSDFVDIGTDKYYNRLKVNDTMKQVSKKQTKVLDMFTALGIKEYNINKAIAVNKAARTIATSTKGDYTGTTGTMTYFVDGKAYRFNTTNDIAASFNQTAFEAQMDEIFSIPGLNLLPKIKEIQRKMLTVYDPLYQLSNIQRDFADSLGFHSKYKTKFFQNYIRAAYNVASNSVYYQEIERTGIIPMNDGKNKFTRILKSFESLPKIAEYMSAKQSGKSDIEAKLDAQDVNLNFARGGSITQSLNKHGWLFLNASVQGFDKFCSTSKRLVTNAKTSKGAMELVLTIGAMAAPGLINSLMNEDDEDYHKLPYYYKNNYYFIKLDDNKFLRLPKGRIVGLTDTLLRYATNVSDENTFDEYIKALGDGIKSSVLPAELSEASPFADINAIKNNETPFGGTIYDESSPIPDKILDSAEYILQNLFGKYGKSAKYILDGDSTTDLWQSNGYVFDSTKYDKNLSTVYDLRDKYQYMKQSSQLEFEDKVIKKYIDAKVYAINMASSEINQAKKDGKTLEEMADLYQMRDALTQDTIDNYKNYEVVKSGTTWTIYFDDMTFEYDTIKDELTKKK